MRTKTIKLYSFSELSEDAKKKVLNDAMFWNVDHDNWYQFTIEDFEEKLNDAGFEDAKICFSGFSSQGDGASFDAKINLEKFCSDKRLLKIAQDSNFTIEKNSFSNHYSHERTRYVDHEITGRKRLILINSALKELEETIESARLSLCREIYRTLEKEYDYLTSDKAIIETIEANDYTFTEDGQLEN